MSENDNRTNYIPVPYEEQISQLKEELRSTKLELANANIRIRELEYKLSQFEKPRSPAERMSDFGSDGLGSNPSGAVPSPYSECLKSEEELREGFNNLFGG